MTAFAFAGAADHAFVDWDDLQYVVENPVVLARDAGRCLRAVVEAEYHPLTVLSLALNASRPLSPRPFIVTNLALHVADTLLVLWLAWLLGGRRLGVATAVALAFGIHPLRVESVVWVSARKDVLYGLFYLLGTIAYWRYLETGERDRLGWALVACVLACLAKPLAVVFPVTMVLLDLWRRRAPFTRAALLEKLPFLAVALVTTWVAVRVQQGSDLGGLLLRLQPAGDATHIRPDLGALDRVMLPLYGPGVIAWRLLVPAGLSPYYPFPAPAETHDPRFVLAALTAVALAALALWDLRRSRVMTLGFGWYLAHLAPTLPFVLFGGFITADRYSYLASIGLLFAAAVGVDRLWRRAPATTRQAWRTALALAGAAAVVVLVALTRRQATYWRDSETLWTRALAVHPALAPAYVYRGKQRALAGQNQAALADFRRALALGDRSADVYQGLGALYGTAGRLDSALVWFDRAVALAPRRPGLYYNRAITRLARGMSREAVADLDRAIALSPPSPGLHLARGHARALAGDPRGAIEDFDRAIAGGADGAELRYERGLSLLVLGDRQGAADDFRRVLRFDPAHAGAREQLKALGS